MIKIHLRHRVVREIVRNDAQLNIPVYNIHAIIPPQFLHPCQTIVLHTNRGEQVQEVHTKENAMPSYGLPVPLGGTWSHWLVL